MIGKIMLFAFVAASMGLADVLDRSKLWTDEEVDAAARKWSEKSVKERGAASQHEALAQWRAGILNSDKLPQNERIEQLGNALRKISMFNIFQVAERVEVYDLAQQKLLAIPGHALFYRDKVNELREQVKAGNLSMDNWSSGKRPYFEALAHMPSEEAVEVLGGFAEDKFGFVFSDDPKDLDVPGLKEYDYSHLDYEINFSVCLPATKALETLIEDPPARAGQREYDRQALWAYWWKEVKAGKRKYRFKGSSVEHPINPPPGTIREARRPAREMDAASATMTADKPDPFSPKNEKPKNGSLQWPVFAGIAAILAALVTYFLRRKSEGR